MFERHQRIVQPRRRTLGVNWSARFTNCACCLPIEYVRREDWIRFSATLDAKMDGLREEMREEIGPLKEKLYG